MRLQYGNQPFYAIFAQIVLRVFTQGCRIGIKWEAYASNSSYVSNHNNVNLTGVTVALLDTCTMQPAMNRNKKKARVEMSVISQKKNTTDNNL